MDTLCRSKKPPFEYTLMLIGGKWKMRIIYELGCEDVLRYGELKKNISDITHRMLRTQLIVRKEYPQIPPKVEHRLSKKGFSLLPIIDEMCKWGKDIAHSVEL